MKSREKYALVSAIRKIFSTDRGCFEELQHFHFECTVFALILAFLQEVTLVRIIVRIAPFLYNTTLCFPLITPEYSTV